MKKLIAVVAVGSLIALAGCGTTARKPMVPLATSQAPNMEFGVSAQTVASFQAGVTTMVQAETILGKPTGAVRTPKGNQIVVYAVQRVEDVSSDRTPETGTALPKRHRVQYSTLLSFDPQGRYIHSWTTTNDLGNASPTALGNLTTGDVEAQY